MRLDGDVSILHRTTVQSVSGPFRHIACCLDDSAASRRALAEARRLRAFGQGRLSLVHVVQFPLPFSVGFSPEPSPNDLATSARGWLNPIGDEIPEAETVLLQGYPAAETCTWAENHAVDLLICAAHRNLPQRLALGSFAHYLVNHAPCPVLVLRPPV